MKKGLVACFMCVVLYAQVANVYVAIGSLRKQSRRNPAINMLVI